MGDLSLSFNRCLGSIQPSLDELCDIRPVHGDEVSSLESLWISDLWVVQPSGRGIVPNGKVIVSECLCGPAVVECETAGVEDLNECGE